ncbi:hypothetical protein K491DRAFT_78467 [Lophiostoma macrostomum CBS 122681]|uniref:Uncharacterized protein n=1 Tax=Lophiostoma macrostomum CBS 122681 TaxID=1314788 RepID=A0A6A6TMZ5_9PLEO|nr:hypothetical protein K491DRAFT_78467 [Lophiostoma macrostomum CBS 122681]
MFPSHTARPSPSKVGLWHSIPMSLQVTHFLPRHFTASTMSRQSVLCAMACSISFLVLFYILYEPVIGYLYIGNTWFHSITIHSHERMALDREGKEKGLVIVLAMGGKLWLFSAPVYTWRILALRLWPGMQRRACQQPAPLLTEIRMDNGLLPPFRNCLSRILVFGRNWAAIEQMENFLSLQLTELSDGDPVLLPNRGDGACILDADRQ